MKLRKSIIAALTAVMSLSLLTACGNEEPSIDVPTEAEVVTEEITVAEDTEEVVEEVTEEVTEEAAEATADDADSEEFNYGEYTYTGDDNILYAINFYICDELAKGYTEGDVGIPYMIEIDRDDSDPNDIKVWGCFWYLTYNLEGDTLVTQAGGSYPGCMHLETTDAGCGYAVTEFEPVADGSDFDSSAKEIFGDKYDKFIETYSDDELETEAREEYLVEYVTSHNVPATKYQDYGWDALSLKLDVATDEVQYIGGLYANDGKSDINMAFFLSSGELVVIVQEGEHIYYGPYTLEDVTLDDGTMYSEITVEGKTYGYQFEDEEQTCGFIIDQDGEKHSALALDESVANDMKAETE